MDLLTNLTTQHRAIEAQLSAAELALRKGNSSVFRAALLEAEKATLAHLDAEDQELYPPLVLAGSRTNRQSLLLLVRSFSNTATRLALSMQHFAEGEAAMVVAARQREFEALRSSLTERFQREEQSLFPLLAKARLRTR